jgi:hypothetical protein
VELFITQANIERYQRLLEAESDPHQRAVLGVLLGAEVETLARLQAEGSGQSLADPGALSASR